MAILVTGGAGYIGGHTCVELLGEGYDIVVLDNFSNSSVGATESVKKITGRNFPVCECDIRDEEGLRRIFTENHIDTVFHFAGLKAVGESVKLPITYYHNNVSGTLTLCNVMKDFGVKNMVFSSSATVYGLPKRVPLTESDPVDIESITNPYGRTKLIIEQLLGDIHLSDKNWNIALLRYFNPIGAHQSGLIGEDPKGTPNNLMPYISRVAAGKLSCLSVFGDDYPTEDGTGVRDYIHVTDLAKGHLSALNWLRTNPGIGAFNLGTGTGYSVMRIVNTFMEVTGQNIPYKFAPRRPGDIAECYADPTKAKEVLGWEAKLDLEQMCYDSWNFQQKLM